MGDDLVRPTVSSRNALPFGILLVLAAAALALPFAMRDTFLDDYNLLGSWWFILAIPTWAGSSYVAARTVWKRQRSWVRTVLFAAVMIPATLLLVIPVGLIAGPAMGAPAFEMALMLPGQFWWPMMAPLSWGFWTHVFPVASTLIYVNSAESLKPWKVAGIAAGATLVGSILFVLASAGIGAETD